MDSTSFFYVRLHVMRVLYHAQAPVVTHEIKASIEALEQHVTAALAYAKGRRAHLTVA